MNRTGFFFQCPKYKYNIDDDDDDDDDKKVEWFAKKT